MGAAVLPDGGGTKHQPQRLCWVWPFRHSPRMGQQVLALAGVARPLVAGWWWVLLALAVGLLPLAAGHALGTSLHQPATALLLAPLFWACVRDDRQGRALGILFVAMGAHSALAIGLAAADPAGAARVLPESDAYWQKTLDWVRTGAAAEYDPAYYLPTHLLLLLALVASSYTTLGLVPFGWGVRQLDVMNYYVGRLAVSSQEPAVALAVGWHPWSFLRAVGYGLLIYEIASLSLERFSGTTLSTPARRRLRWAVGLGFCVADAGLKFAIQGFVRDTLFHNLAPEAL